MNLRHFGMVVTVLFAIMLLIAYYSLSPYLGVGVALTIVGIYLRRNSLQDVVFFSTVAYAVPFAIVLSLVLPVAIPHSYEFFAQKVVSSPYFSNPVFAILVMGTAMASELVLMAAPLGDTGAKLLFHGLPYVFVSIALTVLLFAVIYGIGFRLSPIVIPLIVLTLGLLLVPEKGTSKGVVVVECEDVPVRVVTEKGEIEIWPNPLMRLHSGKFRVTVEVDSEVKAVFVGNKRARVVLSGSDGKRDFFLYR
ncbi:hypothetical protein [Thermococcus sp.]